ncbi:hypothetical protein [Clostridium coskatii]|uniref:Uncharacterized protein n=1 Tax=Clostridium coskatii TaxID=1705578 RepID=A0A162LA17_9CLOT|nr:hypothetical protein [Clostridium coskatii]OAA90806.1 hypothetical protein WX73_01956 [Clostridium coskatii]OBR96840.1 hypothetical protein CLCOS_06840 [Clostridium coskatii]
MKKLNIKSENCLLEVNDYGASINGIDLGKLVRNNLPKLKNYKDYPVKLNLSIELLGNEELEIDPTGYEIPYEMPKEAEENE